MRFLLLDVHAQRLFRSDRDQHDVPAVGDVELDVIAQRFAVAVEVELERARVGAEGVAEKRAQRAARDDEGPPRSLDDESRRALAFLRGKHTCATRDQLVVEWAAYLPHGDAIDLGQPFRSHA